MGTKLRISHLFALGMVLVSLLLWGGPASAAGDGRIIGSTALKVYAQPATSSGSLGSVALNSSVSLQCAVKNGASVTGPYGATTIWHNIIFNNRAAWISDAFVYTGTAGLPSGERWCRTGKIDTLGGGAVPVWTTPTSGVALGTLANSSTVTLYCGAAGSNANGKWGSSTLWHMVGFGTGWGYIPDAAVYTGVNGLPSGEYSCPSTPAFSTTTSTTLTLYGKATCLTQGAVQGIWVESSAGGSKWASWTAVSGTWAATYSASLTFTGTTSNLTLRIGCGGTPSAWRSTAKTPALQATSSLQSNVNCSPPSAGTSTSCTWQSAIPKLGLPYATNEKWTTTGTHDWGGGAAAGGVTTSPYRSSIDFSGGSKNVRAAADGRVHFISCGGNNKGLLMIDHGGDVWTSYYHINIDPSIAEGTYVARGRLLGTIGTNKPCGGTADGAHVHFTVWSISSGTLPTSIDNARGKPLNNTCLGGWKVVDDQRNYWSSYQRLSDGAWERSLQGYAYLLNSGATC